MTTLPTEPKGVTVVLTSGQAADGTLYANTVVFPRGHDWEYNDRRVTIKGTQGERLGEFRDGSYLGIGFRDELRVNRVKEPAPTT